jgi:hypothetical protein
MAVVVTYKGKPELVRVIMANELRPVYKSVAKVNVIENLQQSVEAEAINPFLLPKNIKHQAWRFGRPDRGKSGKTWKQYGGAKIWQRHLI